MSAHICHVIPGFSGLLCLFGIGTVVKAARIEALSPVVTLPSLHQTPSVLSGESLEQNLTRLVGCRDSSECPGEQICWRRRSAQFEADFQQDSVGIAGRCQCPGAVNGLESTTDPSVSFVFWKWRCYPVVPEIGGNCSVSLQCQTPLDLRRHCNPISKRCACDLGTRLALPEGIAGHLTCLDLSHQAGPTTMLVPHPGTLVPEVSPTAIATTSTLATVNATTAIVEVFFGVNHLDSRPAEAGDHDDRFSTVVFIGLALGCVACLGLASCFYMRTAKEKRLARGRRGDHQQVSGRGLLDLMTHGSLPQPESQVTGGVFIVQGELRQSSGRPGRAASAWAREPIFRSRSIRTYGIRGGGLEVDPDCSSMSSSSPDGSSTMAASYLQQSESSRTTQSVSRGVAIEPVSLIRLPPMEYPPSRDCGIALQLPSPHLSVPVLPPIHLRTHRSEADAPLARPRPRPRSLLEPDELRWSITHFGDGPGIPKSQQPPSVPLGSMVQQAPRTGLEPETAASFPEALETSFTDSANSFLG